MTESKRNTIIDLTKPLSTSFIPYSTGKYTDPPLEFSDWSSLHREGFRVTRLSMGTQSGTHIDAPAHFLEDGAPLEALSPDHLMGEYYLLNLPGAASLSDISESLKTYHDEKILFLRTPENSSAKLFREAMQKILSLPPALLVLSGTIEIENSEPFALHRLVAGAAKFLVEDLDQKEAHTLSGHGEIFVFPLRLVGVSGSPCRVIVRVPETKTTGHGFKEYIP
ncbi:MAG: cyclase family protein [Candidatus Moduliflexus flocculans]|nr:cyclase family protein [Candidatus Moduliflexus flocculans]